MVKNIDIQSIFLYGEILKPTTNTKCNSKRKSRLVILRKFIEIRNRLIETEGSDAYDRDVQENDIGKCHALAWVLGLTNEKGEDVIL